MNTFWLAEMQIGSYTVTVIGSSTEQAMKELRKTYLKNDCENWKTGKSFADFVEYCDITPREIKLNTAIWH
jgi:hypothetical protein